MPTSMKNPQHTPLAPAKSWLAARYRPMKPRSLNRRAQKQVGSKALLRASTEPRTATSARTHVGVRFAYHPLTRLPAFRGSSSNDRPRCPEKCVRPVPNIPRRHARRRSSWNTAGDRLSFFGTVRKSTPRQAIEFLATYRRLRCVRVLKTVTIGPVKFVANCRWGLSRRNYGWAIFSTDC